MGQQIGVGATLPRCIGPRSGYVPLRFEAPGGLHFSMLKGHGWAALCATLCSSQAALGHLKLLDPPPRHPEEDLKYGPCGLGGSDTRTTDTAKITTFNPGQTITVVFTETVDHDPSHYRIAFSSAGDTEFEDPVGFDDIRTEYPVLLDNIPDADDGPGHVFSVQVTLPSVTCDSCTLQVIQVMHDKPPWGPEGGDDIYYQCADLILAGDPVDEPPLGSGGSPTEPPTGGGGTETGVPATGGANTTTDDPTPSKGEDGADGSQPESGNGCNLTSKAHSPSPWHLTLFGLVFVAWARRRRSPILGRGAQSEAATTI